MIFLRPESIRCLAPQPLGRALCVRLWTLTGASFLKQSQSPRSDLGSGALAVTVLGSLGPSGSSRVIIVSDMEERQGEGEPGRSALIGPSVPDPVFGVEQMGLNLLDQVVLKIHLSF